MPQKLTPRVEKTPLLVRSDWDHSVCFLIQWSFNSYFSLHLRLGFPDGLFYTIFLTTFFNFRLPSSYISTLLTIFQFHELCFTFMLPHIVTDFFLNNQQDALIIPILFCYKTLHVSGIFSAHHQEFSTAHLALVSFMQVSGDRFQAESGCPIMIPKVHIGSMAHTMGTGVIFRAGV